jgi:quinol monooxygenase YgiN
VFYHQTDIKKALQSDKIPKRFNYNEAIMTNIHKLSKALPDKASNMNKGFVLYYRSIKNQSWYKHDPVKRFLFEHCLNAVQYSLYESTFHGRTITLEAGQLHTSFSQFALESGILGFYQHPLVNSKDPVSASKKAVERTLDYFKQDGSLAYQVFGKGKNKTTVITISNWADFQSGHVPKLVAMPVPNETLTGKGFENNPVPNPVPNAVTENNNTLSKDRVNTIGPNSSNLPAKTRHKKSTAFKQFFAQYPAYRKGGTDAHAWKAWQSEQLNDADALLALNWLSLAAKSSACWQVDANDGFALGITKFIRQHQWLTPLPVSQANDHYVSNPNELSDTRWADGLEVEL